MIQFQENAQTDGDQRVGQENGQTLYVRTLLAIVGD